MDKLQKMDTMQWNGEGVRGSILCPEGWTFRGGRRETPVYPCVKAELLLLSTLIVHYDKYT